MYDYIEDMNVDDNFVAADEYAAYERDMLLMGANEMELRDRIQKAVALLRFSNCRGIVNMAIDVLETGMVID